MTTHRVGVMYRVASSKARRDGGAVKTAQWSRKILLIVAQPDFVSESLAYAIEREFPWISVEQVSALDEACAAFDDPVCLILVDATFAADVESRSGELLKAHPSAQTMLIQEDIRKPIAMQAVFSSRIVRGVLPMNLKLDVWLSVIRLVLRGGEYFPLALFQPLMNAVPARAGRGREAAAQPAAAQDGDCDDFDELTDRELQILAMVSRGLQNKLIAVALRLSEHTVKIHLHNIITKLGAHNRTEAAAIYRDRRAASDAGPDRHQPPRATLAAL